MARVSRTTRARRSVSPLDRLLLDLHGGVAGGGRGESAAAWELVREELITAALERAPLTGLRLPEAWWRYEGPGELAPLELSNGRTAWVGDVLRRRAAWLEQHREELGL